MATIDLGVRVLDRPLVSSDRHRCGKVDDLALEWDNKHPDEGPSIRAIVTGPTALARQWGSRTTAVIAFLYRLMGVTEPEPIEVDWSCVESLGVFIRLNRTRAEMGLDVIDDAINDRFITRLPGSSA